MKKNVKFLTKKLVSIVFIIGMIIQMVLPMTIMADVSYEDGSTISIGGSPTINGSTYEYEHGDVTITKNNVAVTTTSFTVEQNDAIVITLVPDENYTAKLHNTVNGSDANLVENKYSFSIGQATTATISLEPLFNSNQNSDPNPNPNPNQNVDPNESNSDPLPSAIKYDFTINGESFTNVANGDTITVSKDYNMDEIKEFYITKIAIEGKNTYTYAPNEYSYSLIDNQNRKIFETHFDKKSNYFANFRIEAHAGDLLDKDIAQGKTKADYFGFYITGINISKEGFKGVEVTTNIKPDNYDFTVWNGSDLSATTASKPGVVTAYYGENEISLSSSTSNSITEITLSDSSVPASAVSIDNATGKITILSNFYNSIPLKIKLSDGTIGYIKINRIGIFIGDVNKGNSTFYHGAAAGISNNLNVATDQYRIAAVFYHEDTKTYNDYDLIANITYEDGSMETKIAQGVGDIHNTSGNIIGSDYIIWKGNTGTPKSVSVTAVQKGALTNNETFGGATFGSGTGVIWKRK